MHVVDSVWSQRDILDLCEIHTLDRLKSWSERKWWPKRKHEYSWWCWDASCQSSFWFWKETFRHEGSVQLQQHLGPVHGLRARCASARSLAWRFTFSPSLESFKHSLWLWFTTEIWCFRHWQPLKRNALVCVSLLDSVLLWCGTDLLYNASDCNTAMVSQFTGTASASFEYF